MKNEFQHGHVHWYDKMDGEGMIKDEHGNLIFFHDSAAGSYLPLEEKMPVIFSVVEDTTFIQVNKIIGVSR